MISFVSVYKKHYPPALHDEVWRLDRIAKDGALHKKLIKAEIVTVEDFLRLLVKDPQRLRSVRIYFVFNTINKFFFPSNAHSFFEFGFYSFFFSWCHSQYRSLEVECPTGCGRTQWSMQRHVYWAGSFTFTTLMKSTALALCSTIFMSSEAL